MCQICFLSQVTAISYRVLDSYNLDLGTLYYVAI